MENHTEEKTRPANTAQNEAGGGIVENVKSLVQWQFTEEKKTSSKDKELLVIIVCIAIAILAALAKTPILSVLLLISAVTLVKIMRKPAKNLLFNITPIGLFLDEDFVELECVKGFNIIDDPGDCARLILKVEKIVHINEIIPIYDVNITDIERALETLEIPREEELEPTIMDKLTTAII